MSVYSTLKMFHFPDKINSLDRNIDEVLAPVHIRLKPTNACNHSCSFCAYRRDDMQLGKDMDIKDSIPREKIIEMIEDFSEMGVKAVTFTGGGEPLVYKYIDEAALLLAEKKIKFSLLTNGAFLKGAYAEIFSKYATWVRVSIDGFDGESYAMSRNCSVKEFDKVLSNIKAFQELNGTCYLGVSYIINRESAPHVYEMTKQLKDLGVDSVKLSPCIMGNTAEESNAYHNDFFEQTKLLCEKAAKDFTDEKCDVYDSYHLMENKFEKKYDWCPMIQVKPVIGADQNVYSCQDKAYNLDSGLLGNLKNCRFKDFWLKGKETFLKINPAIECNHHCVVNEHNKMLLTYLDTNMDHKEFV